ncbi:MAG: TIGR04282 family arsenosugar biosynthesis glycosyltransferase [Pyrinomonadaceae bacterium]|nr:TIGR04282 family arsenosugar biosynthesis glycosyltransferase [Pyrinomonadaceae bacterium]
MMIKAPQAGTSKTRLVPPLTQDEAAALSVCFLQDTAANIAGVSSQGGAEGVAVYTPVGAEAAFDGLLPERFKLLAQRGEGFGERLLNATEDLLAVGYQSVCLIDSDSPTLPSTLLQAAVSALARAGDRAILGAADDGGYYLIGLKRAHGHLFEKIDWSTPRVLSQTLDCTVTGAISGGCLELDVCERARGVLLKDAPALVRYDTTAADDIVWGLGLGCNGVVEVLLEPLPTRAMPAHLALLAECLNHQERGIIATVFNIRNAAQSVTNAQIKLGSRTLVRGDGNVSREIDVREIAARVEDDAREALPVMNRASRYTRRLSAWQKFLSKWFNRPRR